MSGILSKYISKFFIQQWMIGVARGHIKKIIQTKNFNPDIKWVPVKSPKRLFADPFLYKGENGTYTVLFEDYSMDDTYGKVAAMEIDGNLSLAGHTVLLDTKSHLSYPFIFSENGTTYVMPEAAESGKLTCYKYDPVKKALIYVKEIIELPLLDSTILKHNNKYWLFATLKGKDADNKLFLFFSDTLLGPYTPHPGNPVKTGLEATRPAGKFIEVDGVQYRPSQSSRYTYGEAININKVNILNEAVYEEEFYMSICINRNNKNNRGMHGIHTINCADDLMVVDGTKWRFSLPAKIRQFAIKMNMKGKRKNK